jgi:hypothetical protein
MNQSASLYDLHPSPATLEYAPLKRLFPAAEAEGRAGIQIEALAL